MDASLLFAKAREYLPAGEVAVLERAYDFAAEAHQGQTRMSGEPFIEHPLQVACILADLQLDGDTLVAALLHDVPEDCDVSPEDIEAKFGPVVARLVAGVTKVGRITGGEGKKLPRSSLEAENLRKMLVAVAEDIRVVFIKIADRLHNMRTLEALPAHRRHALADETLSVYAPLAHRLGMWRVKWQLEDLSLRHLQPRWYRQISRLLEGERDQREKFIGQAVRMVGAETAKADLAAEVFGRPKHIYSIYQKIHKYSDAGRNFSDIHDLFALRVLVDTVPDCYKALGVIHNTWRPIPEEFDDYIANPKDNGYRALHTTVMFAGVTPLEIQIRTHEMDYLAKYGVAAHWRYKEGEKAQPGADFPWLHQIQEWREMEGKEFMESVKADILANQVFVYTPQGDIKSLPRGATPLDFAFRIHTELGYRCIGSKVNGRLVPLNYALNNGDVVGILAAKADKGPSLDWLNPELGYVRTTSARGRIRQWFKKQERSQNIETGRENLSKELKRLNLALPTGEQVTRLFHYRSSDEFFAAIGSGNISPSQVAAKLSAGPEIPEVAHISVPSRRVTPSSVKVLGTGDLLTHLADCCHPLPGDEIIGYITQGRGVTVHRKDCVNIVNEVERERLVEVTWGKVDQVYPVTIQVDAWDRVGLLRDISAIIAAEEVNVSESGTAHTGDGMTTLHFTLEVGSSDQLSRVIARVDSLWDVIHVIRRK